MTAAGLETNYRQVIPLALADAMRADPDVFLIGEDIGAAGGAFKSTVGLFEEFGPRRVRDTPISEQAIVGTVLGAAICGLRPVADLMFADFAGVAYDQIANQVAKARYMSGGQLQAPLTIRLANGAGGGFAAQHSQAAENWFLNVPGVKIAVPGTVEDLYGLLRGAIIDDDPVLVFEHKSLFALKGRVPTGSDAVLRLGQAAVVRAGQDVTMVATQLMRHRAVAAAEQLAAEDVAVEVIDPRTLVPFDHQAVVDSLRRTSRLLVVQEGPAAGGWGAALVTRMTTEHFELLDAPPVLITSDPTPTPYAGSLEEAWLPGIDTIVSAARHQIAY